MCAAVRADSVSTHRFGGLQARAERLEEQVKDLNEARKARQMYEDRMRVMEEQRDKASEEKRAQKKRLEELEAQIASMGEVGDQLAKVRPPTPVFLQRAC